MTIKQKETTQESKKEKRQIKGAFLIISITILFIGTFFFGMHYLNLAARNNAEADIATNEVVMEEKIDVAPNELVILHRGQTVDVEKFGVTLSLAKHALLEQNIVDSEILLRVNNKLVDTVNFNHIGEKQDTSGYEIRLISAMNDTIQVVIQSN